MVGPLQNQVPAHVNNNSSCTLSMKTNSRVLWFSPRNCLLAGPMPFVEPYSPTTKTYSHFNGINDPQGPTQSSLTFQPQWVRVRYGPRTRMQTSRAPGSLLKEMAQILISLGPLTKRCTKYSPQHAQRRVVISVDTLTGASDPSTSTGTYWRHWWSNPGVLPQGHQSRRPGAF